MAQDFCTVPYDTSSNNYLAAMLHIRAWDINWKLNIENKQPILTVSHPSDMTHILVSHTFSQKVINHESVTFKGVLASGSPVNM